MCADRNFYSVYGLIIESELVLSQLRPVEASEGDRHPDQIVRVQWGTVPEKLAEDMPVVPKSRYRDTCLLRIPDAGNYLITRDSITIEQLDHATIDDVVAYLLGTVLATVAHLRGLIPLHVSAVLASQGAIAFTGESGAGKSTIAAHIHHQTGWPLISDDVSALYATEDGFALESGVLTVKLWKDALASLDRSSEGLKRDAERMDKFHAIDAEKFVVGRFPLKKLVYLEWGEQDKIETMTGREAFRIVLASVYRPELVDLCQNRENVIAMAISLANTIVVQKITRRKGVRVSAGIVKSLETAGLLETDSDVEIIRSE